MKTLSRNFRKEDLDPLVEILRTNMQEYAIRHYGVWKEDLLRYALKESSMNIRVHEREGKILGFFWMEPMERFLELLEIHVSPPHQRKGLGSQMMREVEQLAQEEGFEEIRLWVFKKNPAVSFYESLGYRITSEDSIKNRLRMVKKL